MANDQSGRRGAGVGEVTPGWAALLTAAASAIFTRNAASTDINVNLRLFFLTASCVAPTCAARHSLLAPSMPA